MHFIFTIASDKLCNVERFFFSSFFFKQSMKKLNISSFSQMISKCKVNKITSFAKDNININCRDSTYSAILNNLCKFSNTEIINFNVVCVQVYFIIFSVNSIAACSNFYLLPFLEIKVSSGLRYFPGNEDFRLEISS